MFGYSRIVVHFATATAQAPAHIDQLNGRNSYIQTWLNAFKARAQTRNDCGYENDDEFLARIHTYATKIVS